MDQMCWFYRVDGHLPQLAGDKRTEEGGRGTRSLVKGWTMEPQLHSHTLPSAEPHRAQAHKGSYYMQPFNVMWGQRSIAEDSVCCLVPGCSQKFFSFGYVTEGDANADTQGCNKLSCQNRDAKKSDCGMMQTDKQAALLQPALLSSEHRDPRHFLQHRNIW